jgi:hypothetical protein
MLTLPYPPRRSHRTGFWLGVALFSGVGLFVVARAFGWQSAWLVGVLGAAALFGAGFVSTELSFRLYRLWNRVASRVNRLARNWVLALIHYLVLSLSRLDGSELDIRYPGGSLWRAYDAGPSHLTWASGGIGWLSQYAREAWQPGRRWWFLLLPLFLVLSLFTAEGERRAVVPENIYTLF